MRAQQVGRDVRERAGEVEDAVLHAEGEAARGGRGELLERHRVDAWVRVRVGVRVRVRVRVRVMRRSKLVVTRCI